jgi:hypothetical protein
VRKLKANEESSVLHGARAALIDVNRLHQLDPETTRKERRCRGRILKPTITIGAIEIQNLPSRRETPRIDMALERQETVGEAGVRPVTMRRHVHGASQR